MKITTGYIKDRLKNYKEMSSFLETTLARVETYKQALNNPKSHLGIDTNISSMEIGSIKGKGGVPSSPVENEILREEYETMFAIEDLREWIKEDLSRAYPLQVEKEQIDGALNTLTKEQKHVIECKYFENMIWRDIAKSVNDNFRQQNFITESGARKISATSVELIAKILDPFYSRMRISQSDYKWSEKGQ